MTYSHTANAALPSAMHRFTAEFGMGSGGTNALLPPGKLVGVRGHATPSPNLVIPSRLVSCEVKLTTEYCYCVVKRALVLYDQATRAISTG